MEYNSQPEDFKSQLASDLDAWIDARLTSREQTASLSNLDPQVIDLTAIAQDLLSLVEDIQPDRDFVLDLEAKLRLKVLKERMSLMTNLPSVDRDQIEGQYKDS